MKSLKTVQVLFRLGKILSKVAFILSIVALCCCLAGLIGLNVGNGEIIKLGGVTLHDLIPEKYGVSINSVSASLIGWLVVCAGEAVLAKAAETCFGNELSAQDGIYRRFTELRESAEGWQIR